MNRESEQVNGIFVKKRELCYDVNEEQSRGKEGTDSEKKDDAVKAAVLAVMTLVVALPAYADEADQYPLKGMFPHTLMTKEIVDVSKLKQEYLDELYIKYPLLKKMYHAVSSFKELLKYGEEVLLIKWLDDVKKLGIAELEKFINGTNRDLEAVKNAIRYKYNNGFAEGSVNKRIMYGRCSFQLLKNKILINELRHKTN